MNLLSKSHQWFTENSIRKEFPWDSDGAPPSTELALCWIAIERRFVREVACAGLPMDPGPLGTVTSSQIVALPEPAQRYAEYMGVVERPQGWSFRLGFGGRFRTRPDQPWMRCEAWQYTGMDLR